MFRSSLRTLALSWVALAAVFALPTAAQATIIRPFDLSGLSREAHVVVRGRVLDQEDRWDEERRRIYRYSTLEVAERIKGADGPARIIVKQIGGVVDGMAMKVAGTADIAVGEEVVLFLRTDGKFHYLVGMEQGKWGVRRVEGRAVVTREPLEPATVKAVDHGGTAVVGPALPAEAAPTGRALVDFLDEVRVHMRAKKPAPKILRRVAPVPAGL